MATRIAVLGAGMVGVCCALSLQRRGYTVTIIDRKPPGRETSFGNSGVFSRSSIFPINGPGLVRQLPRYLANRHPAVRWRASLLARPLWLAGFLKECTSASLARRSRALDGLIALSMGLNRGLVAEAGLGRHLRETGWLKLWRRTDGPSLAQAEAGALAAFGIATRVLDAGGVASLEPDATGPFAAGLLITGSASVDDPGAIVAGYAAMLDARGGQILQAEARAIYRTTTGWRIETTVGPRDADEVVVALGPWSGDILRPLGYIVPMGFERGYHVHLTMPDGCGPRRAVYDVDCGYVVSPMAGGARVTSGVELAARDAPPDFRQIEAAAISARATFGLGAQVESTAWLGARPTLPDSLPMIGPLPGERGLWAAFGHQHIGFSTGAGTGEIIAAMLSRESTPCDAQDFSPARFLGSPG